MYKELKEYAIQNSIPIVEDETLEFLINFIKENNIENILEIGSAIGYSAINMAGSCDIQIETIERDIYRYNIAKININKYNLDNKIKIHNMDALNFDTNEKFDLIFIDASKSQNIKFFEKFKENLSKDGYIITDNLNFHGMINTDYNSLTKNVKGLVRKINSYVDFLNENKEFETKFLSIGDKISISKKI